MKKVFFLLALSCFLHRVNAQSGDAANVEHFQSSTAIKWNPSSLYFGKIGLMGEYNFKRKKSVTFNIGIPMSKKTSVNIDDKDRDVEMKTFSIMGGYRMYLGKKTMSGFYFEP
jgi:hypothetical protein